ncbi:transmembrane protein 235 [Neosynchiropus ocellatus]
MKVEFGCWVVSSGVCGALSFSLLAAALGTQSWYIIKVDLMNGTDSEDRGTHSGLWSAREDGKDLDAVNSFIADYSRYSAPERLLNLRSAVEVLLPCSLVLLFFGGVCGLVSSLTRSPLLLTGTAAYLFVCSLLTLSGVSLYVVYSHQALAETERLVGPEVLAYVHTYFGWSLVLAWFSYGLEVLSGVVLLVAAHVVMGQPNHDGRA